MFSSTPEIKNAAMDHALSLQGQNNSVMSTDQLVDSAEKIYQWMVRDLATVK